MSNSKNRLRKYRIGEIYMVEFSGDSHEQSGWRPGLVVQNNTGNDRSPNLIMLPLTSVIKKLNQPTHVLIKSDGRLRKDSVVLCENPVCISKNKIGRYITTISDNVIGDVAAASMIALGIMSYVNVSDIYSICRRITMLNAI